MAAAAPGRALAQAPGGARRVGIDTTTALGPGPCAVPPGGNYPQRHPLSCPEFAVYPMLASRSPPRRHLPDGQREGSGAAAGLLVTWPRGAASAVPRRLREFRCPAYRFLSLGRHDGGTPAKRGVGEHRPHPAGPGRPNGMIIPCR